MFRDPPVSVTEIIETARSPKSRVLVVLAMLVFELAAIGTTFKHLIDFDCKANWPQAFCAGASSTLVALYCVFGALALLAALRPKPFQTLVSSAGDQTWPLAVNLAGVAAAFVPVLFLSEGTGDRYAVLSLGFWIVGMVALLAGLMLYLAPPRRWFDFVAAQWAALSLVVMTGVAAPLLAIEIRPLWRLDPIVDATFAAVTWTIGALGYAIDSDAETKVIGSGDFLIAVAPVCSGVEGIALVTLFVTLYLVLFRHELRFPHALLLYPVGIAASLVFNVIRISALLVIGLEGNPELAVGGFHSHAGWLMFTLVTLGIIGLAQSVPALRRHQEATIAVSAARSDGPDALQPFWSDPVVAQILPFAVFMLTALIASTLSQTPGLVYPLRMLVVGGVVLAFLPVLAKLPWRLDPAAIAAGAVVGAFWIAIPVSAGDATPPHGGLAGGLLLLWMVMRGLGTIVLVPLVEELFFRGYLERRLRLYEGRLWIGIAALVTAGLFALLHDRWAEAFAASLMFSFIALRRGNVTDAVLAHAVANAIIFGFVAATGQIHII